MNDNAHKPRTGRGRCRRQGCTRPADRANSNHRCCSALCAWIYREQGNVARWSLKVENHTVLDERQDILDRVAADIDRYYAVKEA